MRPPGYFYPQGTSPADLVRRLLDLVNYEDYLKHKDQEWATRWENVQELINFASEPPSELGSGAVEGATESEENAYVSMWGRRMACKS